jgi:cell wall-associated NlpC family hydrolase
MVVRRLRIVASVLTVLAVSAVWLAPVAPAAASTAPPAPARLTALRWAEAQAGKPYIYGGTGPYGFDCSGLVMEAYRHAGIALPRTTYAMWASSHLRRIPASQRQRGDIAFYGLGHVELVTSRGTFGALQQGDPVGWHHPSGWWQVTAYFRAVR